MNFEEKKTFIINVAVLFVTAVMIIAVSRILIFYLLPFVIGTVLAFAVQKPARKIAAKGKLKHGTVAAVLVAVIYVLGAGFLTLCVWKLFLGMHSLITDWPKRLAVMQPRLDRAINSLSGMSRALPDAYGQTVERAAQGTLQTIIDRLMNLFSDIAAVVAARIPSVLFSTFVTVAASCYIAKDFDALTEFVKGFLKPKTTAKLKDIRDIFVNDIFKFMCGYLILSLITFAELILGLVILRVRHAVLIALLIVLVDILPVLGSGTVLVPWAALLLFSGNFFRGFGLLALYVIITAARYFLEPRIVGKQIGIRPVFMLLVMFVGLKVGGIGGLLFLPIIFVVVIDYYKLQISRENQACTNE
ncbi:MAG: sporulation integral membrane protein YtvI [Clostridia bacterium]|nr:sporulation integral membrane protein YtvI [Clostridia bacterium]